MPTNDSEKVTRQLRGTGGKELEEAQAASAGKNFEWHYGRVNSLGSYELAGGKSVSIAWEDGSTTSEQGNISDDQWEIFKLAFMTTGRIAVLSDLPRNEALYDYRFLEAVRY